MINELIEVPGCENSAENPALSPPNRNFTFLNKDFGPNIAEKALEKIENCGKKTVEFVNTVSTEIVEFVVYCDNRICSNPDCKRHRGYKFTKEHYLQIESLKKQFDKPYAYVFTGWVLPVESISRRWLQNKLLFLYKLLKESSIGGFSVHMEIKLYPVGHKNYGNAYVHFHCVSNFIRDIGSVRAKWKRVVRSEKALTEEKIVKYISKYSSKTPFFATDVDRYCYHNLVYKTQMHRFCVQVDNNISRVKSDFYPLSLLEYEVYCTYKREFEKKRIHHPFLDDFKNRDKPPDEFIDESNLVVSDKTKNTVRLKWYHPVEKVRNKKYKDCYDRDTCVGCRGCYSSLDGKYYSSEKNIERNFSDIPIFVEQAVKLGLDVESKVEKYEKVKKDPYLYVGDDILTRLKNICKQQVKKYE